MKTYSQAQTSCRPAAEQVPAARESKSAWREENRRGGWRREEKRGEGKGREQTRWLAKRREERRREGKRTEAVAGRAVARGAGRVQGRRDSARPACLPPCLSAVSIVARAGSDRMYLAGLTATASLMTPSLHTTQTSTDVEARGWRARALGDAVQRPTLARPRLYLGCISAASRRRSGRGRLLAARRGRSARTTWSPARRAAPRVTSLLRRLYTLSLSLPSRPSLPAAGSSLPPAPLGRLARYRA